MALWYHKTDSYRWLTGSIRQDLQPDERSIWADLMALAALTRGARRGYIERSEGIPYDKAYLLTFLNIEEELFDRAIEKCVCEGRLQVFDDGTMLLTNWNDYNDVADFEVKREIKRVANRKSASGRESLADMTKVLTRRLNELNTHLRARRYELAPDGRVLDTATGTTMSVEELSCKEAEAYRKENG